MHLSRGFALTKRYFALVLVPILLDILQLGDILRRAKDNLNVKFTIPASLPSLTQVLPEPAKTSDFTVNLPFSYVGSGFVLLFLVFILVSAFLRGGFLGCILKGVEEQDFDFGTFIEFGKEYFGRFILQMLFIVGVVVGAVPVLMLLGPLALLVLLGVLVLFIYIIFWDYAMVADNLGII